MNRGDGECGGVGGIKTCMYGYDVAIYSTCTASFNQSDSSRVTLHPQSRSPPAYRSFLYDHIVVT